MSETKQSMSDESSRHESNPDGDEPYAQSSGPNDASAQFSTDGSGHMFPCEGCGADLQFSIGVQSLKCSYCGFVKELEFNPELSVDEQNYAATLEQIATWRNDKSDQTSGLSEVPCSTCGAKVQFQGTLTSSACAYCGVALQLEDVHDADNRVPVDGVMAFRVDRIKAHEALAGWIKSRWFAPNRFKKEGIEGKFSGLYTPYWTFDTLTTTHYDGQRGDYYYVTTGSGKNKRRVRKTRWSPASGTFQRFFDDELIVAASGVPVKRLDALQPWPLRDCRPFNQEMLAGFLARTYDVELDEGFATAKLRFEKAIEADVRSHIGGDTQRIHNIDTQYNAITYKHLLLPIWMLGYRYADKVYQVVVNATTAEVQGDRPYSWVKITFAILTGLAAAGGFAYLASR